MEVLELKNRENVHFMLRILRTTACKYAMGGGGAPPSVCNPDDSC